MLKALLLTVVATGCVAEVAEPDGSDQPGPTETAYQPEAPPAVVPRIVITNASCAKLAGGLDIIATVEATLPVGHALEVDYDFVGSGPTTGWQSSTRFGCALWHRTTITEQAGFDLGCDRTAGQPESQQVTMRRYLHQDAGTFSGVSTIDVVAVVTTKPLDGDWMKVTRSRVTCE